MFLKDWYFTNLCWSSVPADSLANNSYRKNRWSDFPCPAANQKTELCSYFWKPPRNNRSCCYESCSHWSLLRKSYFFPKPYQHRICAHWWPLQCTYARLGTRNRWNTSLWNRLLCYNSCMYSERIDWSYRNRSCTWRRDHLFLESGTEYCFHDRSRYHCVWRRNLWIIFTVSLLPPSKVLHLHLMASADPPWGILQRFRLLVHPAGRSV